MSSNPSVARIARWHVVFGLAFAVLGMALGIYMASTQNHGQHATHAHILLLGFVTSVSYGSVYRLWLGDAGARIAMAQTALHQFGTAVIVVGLFLLYGGGASEAALGPVLGIGSIAALLGALLMLIQFAAPRRTTQARPADGTVQKARVGAAGLP